MEALFNVPASVCNPFGCFVRRDTVFGKTRVAAIPSGIGATLNYVLKSVSYLFRGEKMLSILSNIYCTMFYRLPLEETKCYVGLSVLQSDNNFIRLK